MPTPSFRELMKSRLQVDFMPFALVPAGVRLANQSHSEV